jgi:osmotically inducible protein OsmC
LRSEEGHPPAELRTTAGVRLEQTDAGFRITRIELRATGEVPGIEERAFAELAEWAKATYPVSRALAGTEIMFEAPCRKLTEGGEPLPRRS